MKLVCGFTRRSGRCDSFIRAARRMRSGSSHSTTNNSEWNNKLRGHNLSLCKYRMPSLYHHRDLGISKNNNVSQKRHDSQSFFRSRLLVFAADIAHITALPCLK
jgi:hypothetical protein